MSDEGYAVAARHELTPEQARETPSRLLLMSCIFTRGPANSTDDFEEVFAVNAEAEEILRRLDEWAIGKGVKP